MRVLFVAVEAAPFAKVGGLADVVGSLPAALRADGLDARLALPDYAMIETDGRWELEDLGTFEVELRPGHVETATLRRIVRDGGETYLIGHAEFFRQARRSEEIYRPGIDQYLFFTCAALTLPSVLGWRPNVVHWHDWQTGFGPVLMRERPAFGLADVASVMTIHNLAYQGEFEPDILDRLGLPLSLFNHHQVEAWGRVNFLKSGASYADEVNTVSPTYADQIQTPEYGANLDGLMRHLGDAGRLRGILNGISTDDFDPARDPALAEPFDSKNLKGKAACREALLAEVGMAPIKGAVLAGLVSRISSQKGFDLFVDAAPELFALPMQVVILGAGDPAIAERLAELEARYPDHLRFVDGFDHDLGSRIYGGADTFLMPSAFEPCGLGQMIAMRYGTPPLVRSTGGLADTVVEGVNGFAFVERSPEAFLAAARRMLMVFRAPKRWLTLQRRAMAEEFGWPNGAKAYAKLYAEAIRARQTIVPRSKAG